MSASGHRENYWQRIYLSALICHTNENRKKKKRKEKRPPDKTRSMMSPNNKCTGNKCANIFFYRRFGLEFWLHLFLSGWNSEPIWKTSTSETTFPTTENIWVVEATGGGRGGHFQQVQSRPLLRRETNKAQQINNIQTATAIKRGWGGKTRGTHFVQSVQ